VRLLVLHAWLKGNLGDVLQLSVLLRALRELGPGALDLAGYPAQPAAETDEVLTLVDRYLPDHFPRYWSLAPAPVGRAVFEPWWRRRRRALFARYDAIVCAPGPYLADYDARAVSAVSDITIAADMGLPVALSSHSIGPLQPDGIAAVGRAAVRVAREHATGRYLRDHGLTAVASADLAFVYPYPRVDAPARIDGPYRLVFLRGNNLRATRLRVSGGALFEESTLIADASQGQLVLATSDHRRDARFLAGVARTLGLTWIPCRSVADLTQFVAGSSGVVSDRYHPAICAAVLGKPAQVLSNREPHKMRGLKDLLADHTLAELQELARAGLRAVQDAVRGAR
jgi:polysaccharide pyruvyl transferase WcaK-like protein